MEFLSLMFLLTKRAKRRGVRSEEKRLFSQARKSTTPKRIIDGNYITITITIIIITITNLSNLIGYQLS